MVANTADFIRDNVAATPCTDFHQVHYLLLLFPLEPTELERCSEAVAAAMRVC
jgi:hypothetical protein